MAAEFTLGEIGFNAYGDTPGAEGPWKTFDGRPMPKWAELSGDTGALTKERWEAAAKAIINAHENRKRVEAGQAIRPRTTGA
jgi:hypothetical protein